MDTETPPQPNRTTALIQGRFLPLPKPQEELVGHSCTVQLSPDQYSIQTMHPHAAESLTRAPKQRDYVISLGLRLLLTEARRGGRPSCLEPCFLLCFRSHRRGTGISLHGREANAKLQITSGISGSLMYQQQLRSQVWMQVSACIRGERTS